MCQFKSGIILKNKVVVAPIYNDSHSALLNQLGIEDDYENAARKFVRAELVPKNKNRAIDPKEWKYIVDQDVVPDWYSEDPGRYEGEFRAAVEEYVKEHIVIMAGKPWSVIKQNEVGIYYLMEGSLFDSTFGEDNNYVTSYVREKLNNSDLAKQLKEECGDRIVTQNVDLTSLDGFKDYGSVAGDVLSIPTLDLYRECREKISCLSDWWWLSTPDSTPSGMGAVCVESVRGGGYVSDGRYHYADGVRPVLILKS